MGRVTACALVAVLALTGVGCGGSGKQPISVPAQQAASVAAAKTDVGAGRGPFVPGGGIATGPGSSLWGDRSSGPDGMQVGCVSRRHLAIAVMLRNRSREAVMLVGAAGPDSPSIISRVAVQLRLAPPPPSGDMLFTPLRHWSAAPAVPVMIPPGRSAIVQSNFLMRHCNTLTGAQTLTVGGSLTLSYRQAAHSGQQRVTVPGARIILARGPSKHPCSPVAGSSRLLAAGISCGLARQAALACRHMSHGSWGDCSTAQHNWGCSLAASSVQVCEFARRPAHWFRVRWTR